MGEVFGGIDVRDGKIRRQEQRAAWKGIAMDGIVGSANGEKYNWRDSDIPMFINCLGTYEAYYLITCMLGHWCHTNVFHGFWVWERFYVLYQTDSSSN